MEKASVETRSVKERPILYSSVMIQAKLAGRKTQTRRIIKQDLSRHFASSGGPCEGSIKFFQGRWGCPECGAFHATESLKCPWAVGDILWARETWSKIHYEGVDPAPTYFYRADDQVGAVGIWKPSIHMPKVAARIWERITNIRVERLQDISEKDAVAEGIFPCDDPLGGWTYRSDIGWLTAKDAYRALWIEINGLDSLELNPWVWVITTEVLSTTGKPKNL